MDYESERKIGEYVSRNVHACASELVSEVGPKLLDGVFDDYGEDDYYGLFQTEPDIDDCQDQANAIFFERDGEWYYVTDGQDVEDEEIGEYTPAEIIQFAGEEECLGENLCLFDALVELGNVGYTITRNHSGHKLPKTYTLWKKFDLDEAEGPFDDEDEAVRECIQDHDILGAEVYEHWIVSSHLAYKLQEHGQTVKDFFGLTLWCRCCTGQAISMDHVIQEIYKEVHDHA